MKKLQLDLLFLVTFATLCNQPAHAAPNSYTHANGSTVVNINQADKNGLSHNMYQEFNVPKKGMILNNSTTDLVRESGNIARNSNLDTSATLILNEVISHRASSLNGFIEVAGEKADVIIANPNGITCSGCSFINTGRATLTTGKPDFTGSALTGFDVAKGTITVEGNGLKGADYTELLAQKIALQGQIETTQLKAVAGKYTYDRDSGLATATATSRASGNTIDVSALGGATAGIIQLQTTETGAGVNNNGVLNATSLYISSAGVLTNSGTISAGLTSAVASGKMINKGMLSTQQAVLQTSDAFENSGTLKTTDYATIVSQGKITNNNKSRINSDGAVNMVSLAGDINNKGTITTYGTLTIQTGYNTVDDVVTAVASTSVLNSGVIWAENLSISAVKNISLSAGGKVTSPGTAYLSATKVFNAASLIAQNASIVANEVRNKGVIQTAGRLNVSGKNDITNSGTMKAGTLTLITDEKVSNAYCLLWLLCDKGTLSADTIQITAPKLTAMSDLGGYYTTQLLELNKPATADISL